MVLPPEDSVRPLGLGGLPLPGLGPIEGGAEVGRPDVTPAGGRVELAPPLEGVRSILAERAEDDERDADEPIADRDLEVVPARGMTCTAADREDRDDDRMEDAAGLRAALGLAAGAGVSAGLAALGPAGGRREIDPPRDVRRRSSRLDGVESITEVEGRSRAEPRERRALQESR